MTQPNGKGKSAQQKQHWWRMLRKSHQFTRQRCASTTHQCWGSSWWLKPPVPSASSWAAWQWGRGRSRAPAETEPAGWGRWPGPTGSRSQRDGRLQTHRRGETWCMTDLHERQKKMAAICIFALKLHLIFLDSVGFLVHTLLLLLLITNKSIWCQHWLGLLEIKSVNEDILLWEFCELIQSQACFECKKKSHTSDLWRCFLRILHFSILNVLETFFSVVVTLVVTSTQQFNSDVQFAGPGTVTFAMLWNTEAVW